MKRLIISTASTEFSIRSSALDEPLTPTDFNIDPISTTGSTQINAAKIDSMGVFVDASAERLFALNFDAASAEYVADELTKMVPDLFQSNAITQICVQRKPDTRIHCVREDGSVAVVVFDRAESVICWVIINTAGVVEDVSVLPGPGEDQVYYVVRRTLDGTTVRYHEKWAQERECQGGLLNKQADSFLAYSGAPVSTVSLPHLDGHTVVAWCDGKDFGSYTVVANQITFPVAVTNYVVGLSYEARFKSMKLMLGQSTPLHALQRLISGALILRNTHWRSLFIGQDFDHLTQAIPQADIPREDPSDRFSPVDEQYIFASYDAAMSELDGEYETDMRFCLKAVAPLPCTVCGVGLVVSAEPAS